MNQTEACQFIDQRDIDTIILGLPDLEGRFLGKRVAARHFLENAAGIGVESCSYLLASDIDLEKFPNNRLMGWESGFEDMRMLPDYDGMRSVPWLERTVFLPVDVYESSGRRVDLAPRQVLRRQIERLNEHGLFANVSTELEFLVFENSFREAWENGYREMRPMPPYNSDYILFDGGGVEGLIGRIRREMMDAGLYVESSKGEVNAGQHEVNLRYDEALKTADDHLFYKEGAKEIARQEDRAITFMAKFDSGAGNSCHIHLSLVDAQGSNAFVQDRRLFDQFIAGQLACLEEFTLLYAPHVNSYKRFVDQSFAPTKVSWGYDNRTCAIRVLGEGAGLRLEHRLPGGDVQPHLAIAGIIAAGLRGLEDELELDSPTVGNAYDSDLPQVPSNMYEACERFSKSDAAQNAFGEDVVAHLVAHGTAELAASQRNVSEWERTQGFERR